MEALQESYDEQTNVLLVCVCVCVCTHIYIHNNNKASLCACMHWSTGMACQCANIGRQGVESCDLRILSASFELSKAVVCCLECQANAHGTIDLAH